MDLTDIMRMAEQIEDMKWRAQAYDSISDMLDNKCMAVVPGVDHTTEPATQIYQLIQRTVEWDYDTRQWKLLR